MNEITVTEQYKKAAELNQRIIFTAQMAQKNLYDMCVLLKEMRDDKLYKELGYQNFEDYCEQEIGFSRRNARNYIAVIEHFDGKSISRFGVTKLSLLAALSESEQEKIQATVNVEDTSVRELKAEIAKLKDSRNAAESDLLELKSKNRKLSHELEEAKKVVLLSSNKFKHNTESEQFKAQLDKAQQEIQDLKKSMSADQKTQDALIRQLDAQLSNADQKHANETNRLRQQYQQKINELQEKLDNAAYTEVAVETVEVPATMEIFSVYCQSLQNTFDQLIDFICNLKEKRLEYRDLLAKMIDSMDDSVYDITSE